MQFRFKLVNRSLAESVDIRGIHGFLGKMLLLVEYFYFLALNFVADVALDVVEALDAVVRRLLLPFFSFQDLGDAVRGARVQPRDDSRHLNACIHCATLVGDVAAEEVPLIDHVKLTEISCEGLLLRRGLHAAGSRQRCVVFLWLGGCVAFGRASILLVTLTIAWCLFTCGGVLLRGCGLVCFLFLAEDSVLGISILQRALAVLDVVHKIAAVTARAGIIGDTPAVPHVVHPIAFVTIAALVLINTASVQLSVPKSTHIHILDLVLNEAFFAVQNSVHERTRDDFVHGRLVIALPLYASILHISSVIPAIGEEHFDLSVGLAFLVRINKRLAFRHFALQFYPKRGRDSRSVCKVQTSAAALASVFIRPCIHTNVIDFNPVPTLTTAFEAAIEDTEFFGVNVGAPAV
mmetsp:Transcript_1947/g.3222  ORF Transcript_1947/g.3222 Transcript_1947/m.3222 type:complete len:406 (-) Transcript_1947:896-2113(-)